MQCNGVALKERLVIPDRSGLDKNVDIGKLVFIVWPGCNGFKFVLNRQVTRNE